MLWWVMCKGENTGGGRRSHYHSSGVYSTQHNEKESASVKQYLTLHFIDET